MATTNFTLPFAPVDGKVLTAAQLQANYTAILNALNSLAAIIAGGAVASVNGQTGVVVLTPAAISALDQNLALLNVSGVSSSKWQAIGAAMIAANALPGLIES